MSPEHQQLLADAQQRIAQNKLMIFMKGTPDQPQCGFSWRAAEVLKALGRPFGHKNIFDHPDYLDVLAEWSSWETSPQIFLDGKLLGGCDIVTELYQSGELQKMVEESFSGVKQA
jgi:monothiol glutaredoxin